MCWDVALGESKQQGQVIWRGNAHSRGVSVLHTIPSSYCQLIFGVDVSCLRGFISAAFADVTVYGLTFFRLSMTFRNSTRSVREQNVFPQVSVFETVEVCVESFTL